MSKMLHESRIEAQERLTENAAALGANAILAMRFDVMTWGSLPRDVRVRHRGQSSKGYAHITIQAILRGG